MSHRSFIWFITLISQLHSGEIKEVLQSTHRDLLESAFVSQSCRWSPEYMYIITSEAVTDGWAHVWTPECPSPERAPFHNINRKAKDGCCGSHIEIKCIRWWATLRLFRFFMLYPQAQLQMKRASTHVWVPTEDTYAKVLFVTVEMPAKIVPDLYHPFYQC